MRRILLLAAALAIPASGTFVVLGPSGTAGAGVPPIVCTSITGNAASTIMISGCSGGNGTTGGAALPLPATALAAGGAVNWVSGNTTTIAPPTLKTSVGKKCPGYVKGGATNPSEVKFRAAVTGDVGDGIKVPGSAKGAVCIAADGTITNLGNMSLK